MAQNVIAIKAKFDELRTLAFGSISGTYALAGTTFTHAPRLIKITNETNVGLYIAYDRNFFAQNKQQDTISAGSSLVYDVTANRSEQGGSLFLPQLNGVWIKDRGSAASSGSVYVTVMYAD